MESGPPSIDDAAQPALRKLEADQEEVIEDLRDGFTDEWEYLTWVHDVSTASLGEIEDERLKAIWRDKAVKSYLVEKEGDKDDQSDAVIEKTKQGLEDYILQPPFKSAYRNLTPKANEYLPGDNRPSTHPNAPVALLPAVAELTRRQEAAIVGLREGFDTYEGLLDWRRELIGASYGKISKKTLKSLGKKDPVFTAAVTHGAVGCEPPSDPEWLCKRVACYILLPVFNAGLRTMVKSAGEDLNAGKDSNRRDTLDV